MSLSSVPVFPNNSMHRTALCGAADAERWMQPEGASLMSRDKYDREAEELSLRLPSGPRLAVIGSASFWGDDSHAICQSVGARLAELDRLVLVTGGVPGVGEAVGRSFFGARQRSSLPPKYLPRSTPWL